MQKEAIDMKKFLTVMFLIMICVASVTYAANYPKYLNWDNNCQLIWTYSRNGLYLKRDSIIVEQLDKNNYIITADIVNVSYPVDKDNYNDEQITFADNANERTPCVLVLDCSGSMRGEPIKQLNAGLVALEKELRKY